MLGVVLSYLKLKKEYERHCTVKSAVSFLL